MILGENGIGKTTLLQCLAGMEPIVDQATFRNGGMEKPALARLPKLYFNKMSLDISQFLRAGKDKTEINVSIAMGGTLASKDFQEKAIGSLHLKRYFENVLRSFNEKPHLGFDKLNELICYGYGVSRRMREEPARTEPPDDSTLSLFSSDAVLRNSEEWLLQLDHEAAKGDKSKRTLFKTVENLLIGGKNGKKLLPDVTNIRIAPTHVFGVIGEPLRVQFETSYGWVLISELSHGYRTVITWMVDLARRLFDRYPDGDALSKPAIVLVDEFDLHLHPKWQRELIEFLSDRFPNTQFIVTAHSPLIVQAAVSANANIAVLQQEGDHVVIDQSPPAIRGWRVDQILASDLFGGISPRGPELDDLLARRNAILSKGTLTDSDHTELAELRQQIGKLPTGETPADIEAMDLIHEAANYLKQQKR
ncbi:MAG: AAA family ATPase [Blastocatellia bacterium]|nr:AAA family ATPase [Blastocatellia bacterium]